MREILSTVMTVLCIGWCIYGFVVWRRWDKAAKKTNELLDYLLAEPEEEGEV